MLNFSSEAGSPWSGLRGIPAGWSCQLPEVSKFVARKGPRTSNELEGLGDVATKLFRVWHFDINSHACVVTAKLSLDM